MVGCLFVSLAADEIDTRFQQMIDEAVGFERGADLPKAYEIYERAHAMAEQAGRTDLAARALFHQALSLTSEAALEEAVVYHDRVIELAQNDTRIRDLSARAQLRRAMAINAMGGHALADEALETVAPLIASIGDPELSAFESFALVDILTRRQEFAGALSVADEAIAFYEEAEDTSKLTALYGLKAWCLQQIGAFEEARDAYHRQLQEGFAAGMQRHVAVAFCNLGDVERALGKPEIAEQHIDRSIKLLDKLRATTTGGPSARRSYFDLQVSAYHTKIISLLDRFETAEAFEISEQFRGRSFLEQAEGRETTDSLSEEEQRVLSELLATQRHLLAGDLNSEQEARLEELEKSWLMLQRNRERQRPLPDPKPNVARVSELQSHLPKNSAYLSFWVHPHRTLVWVVTREGIEVVQIPVEARRIGKLVDSYLEPIRNRAVAEDTALRGTEEDHLRVGRRLYDLLIEPVREFTGPRRHLIVSPNGPLWYLPLESLVRELPAQAGRADQEGQDGQEKKQNAVDEDAPLFDAYARASYAMNEFSFTYVPSARVWIELKNRRAAASGFVGIAPSLEGTRSALERGLDLDPLPGARKEAEALGQLFSESKTLIGSAAVEGAVKKAVKNRRYVHFAAHGYLNDERPTLSGVMLWPEEEEDGLLQGFEATDLPWKAELVSLAVCNSAMGQLSQGEGLLGFARTVLVGGARNALVTLWRVDDQASHRLVEAFYSELREGTPIPIALRRARQTLLTATAKAEWAGTEREFSLGHPYFWAPYVLIGGDALEAQPRRPSVQR